MHKVLVVSQMAKRLPSSLPSVQWVALSQASRTTARRHFVKLVDGLRQVYNALNFGVAAELQSF